MHYFRTLFLALLGYTVQFALILYFLYFRLGQMDACNHPPTACNPHVCCAHTLLVCVRVSEDQIGTTNQRSRLEVMQGMANFLQIDISAISTISDIWGKKWITLDILRYPIIPQPGCIFPCGRRIIVHRKYRYMRANIQLSDSKYIEYRPEHLYWLVSGSQSSSFVVEHQIGSGCASHATNLYIP